MASLTSFIDTRIKEETIVKRDEIPFEVRNPKPSKETLKALKEAQDIIDGKISSKGYHDVHQMFLDILNED